MPIANSTAELEQMIRKQMMNALQVVQSKVEADMFEEVGKFYTQGNPRLYQRTGNLGSSPRTTGISGGGNSASFEAYLEPGGYTVPNPVFTSRGYASYFSPLQVLTAAESHAAHILGKGGFWSRSLKRMKEDLISTFSTFFN